jgi:cytochrome c oxidase subunit 2
MKSVSKLEYLTIIMIAGLLAIACGISWRAPQIFRPTPGPSAGPGSQSASNGERIYFTAMNEQGESIEYTGGPNFGGMMMGSYLTCAACHGPEARGGTHYMHMWVMEAPDIRYKALNSEAGEHAEEEESGEHGEYTLEDFHMAVVEGEHPDGQPLDSEMPRWQISDEDLADLFEFLKSLP